MTSASKVNISFFPPKSLEDITKMDQAELLEGYLLGLHGGPEPRDSRAKWTGWRNGMVDSGRRQPDEAQRRIARLSVIEAIGQT